MNENHTQIPYKTMYCAGFAGLAFCSLITIVAVAFGPAFFENSMIGLMKHEGVIGVFAFVVSLSVAFKGGSWFVMKQNRSSSNQDRWAMFCLIEVVALIGAMFIALIISLLLGNQELLYPIGLPIWWIFGPLVALLMIRMDDAHHENV